MSDADLDDFRQRCRTFLAEHATGVNVAEGDDPRAEHALAAAKQFQGALVEAGLAGLTYPKEYGGQGLTAAHERVWREEAGTFPVMTRQLSISHGMALPMLNEYGSDEQRSTYQAKVIGAEEVWCQMFSEPGAGSDVASLQSRAVLDGDEWILNGQKVWTTLAHVCERGLIIARTDLDQPKHRGISMFILDMSAPGVEIRPIHQIDGGMRFNEVFFTDVRIPADHRIGPLNEGWRLATAMLMYERVAIGGGQALGISHGRADLPDQGSQEPRQPRRPGAAPADHGAVFRRGGVRASSPCRPVLHFKPARPPVREDRWASWPVQTSPPCIEGCRLTSSEPKASRGNPTVGGPTRRSAHSPAESPAAPTRFSATSSASESWDYPASRPWTKIYRSVS